MTKVSIKVLMKAANAADYLDLSETEFRRRVEDGAIKPRRAGYHTRLYHIDDLNAYADSLPVDGEAVSDNVTNAVTNAPGPVVFRSGAAWKASRTRRGIHEENGANRGRMPVELGG